MSSTNRGAERAPYDFYATPAATTRSLLRWLREVGVSIEGRILDPFAGDGAILRALIDDGHCPSTLHAVEIRPEMEAALHSATLNVAIGDWFGAQPAGGAVIITNPPYSEAERAIRSCCAVADTAIMLLRLNFWGSRKRAGLFRDFRPAYCLPLVKRPSFTGNGKVDSIEYAWFIWQRGHRAACLTERLED